MIVQTDASAVALAGVLMQDLGKGLHPIAFESKQFSSAAEQNHHAGERELATIHHCTTQTWRHYLIFTEFRLVGDHAPLKWLFAPASRRPDYVQTSARDGLKEAGYVDLSTDQPVTAEEGRRAAGAKGKPSGVPKVEAEVNAALKKKDVEKEGPSLHWTQGSAQTPDLWRDVMDTVAAGMAAIPAFAGVTTRAQRAAAAEQPSTGDDPVSPAPEMGLQVIKDRQYDCSAAFPSKHLACEICKRTDGETFMLPCDTCNKGHHTITVSYACFGRGP
eukprot:gene11765-biopygen12079